MTEGVNPSIDRRLLLDKGDQETADTGQAVLVARRTGHVEQKRGLERKTFDVCLIQVESCSICKASGIQRNGQRWRGTGFVDGL